MLSFLLTLMTTTIFLLLTVTPVFLVGNCSFGGGYDWNKMDNLAVKEFCGLFVLWSDLSSSPPGPYGQEVYMFRPEERFKAPPILPPHLLQVILNKDTNISVSFSLLWYTTFCINVPISSPVSVQNCHVVSSHVSLYVAIISFYSVILPCCLSPTMWCWIIFMPYQLR